MADAYELPEDLGTLSDEDIEQHLTAAAREMKKIATADVATAKTVPALRSLRDTITSLKTEQDARITAAAETAAEIDALMAETFGEDETETTASAEAEATTEAAPEAEDETPKVVEPTTVVTASARRSMNLAAVRAAKAGNGTGLSRYLPAEQPREIEIVASVDVPGYRPGQEIDLGQITEGVMRRATGLKTAGGGTGMVASYRLPFPAEQIVNDSSSAPEGTNALMLSSDQRRLNGGDLVASGGWCAPSETIYDITDIACPDMLWDAPEVQLNRGGLRFFRTPTLDVAALTWTWTEAQDIAAATQPGGPDKPCFVIPCPAPIDVRAQAIGVCLQVGILTQRFFPEMVDWYVRNSMIAHEIRIKTAMYDAARNSAATTAVTMRDSFATFSAVYEAVALQAADMIERHNLCDSTQLEVVFPWWSKNMMLTDLARQEGKDMSEVGADDIQRAFSELGVRVQWARGLPPAVGAGGAIGQATPATTWPTQIEFLIYPAGNFQIGRGPEINLGVIIDSVTVATNDEKIFSEEAVVLIDRMGLARRVTLEVCANGEVGARNAVDLCPTIPAP
ncbi:major capsid hexamer protein [Streptomyces phage Xkcd426]|nr:major capsid hexamer protein [Streptomyces phage Xkcd426]